MRRLECALHMMMNNENRSDNKAIANTKKSCSERMVEGSSETELNDLLSSTLTGIAEILVSAEGKKKSKAEAKNTKYT